MLIRGGRQDWGVVENSEDDDDEEWEDGRHGDESYVNGDEEALGRSCWIPRARFEVFFAWLLKVESVHLYLQELSVVHVRDDGEGQLYYSSRMAGRRYASRNL